MIDHIWTFTLIFYYLLLVAFSILNKTKIELGTYFLVGLASSLSLTISIQVLIWIVSYAT